MMKWAISESKTRHFGLWFGVYHNAVWREMSCITPDLTFLYTFFAKIFCQNFVKKNCKLISRVFLKNTDNRNGKSRGKYLS